MVNPEAAEAATTAAWDCFDKSLNIFIDSDNWNREEREKRERKSMIQ